MIGETLGETLSNGEIVDDSFDIFAQLAAANRLMGDRFVAFAEYLRGRAYIEAALMGGKEISVIASYIGAPAEGAQLVKTAILYNLDSADLVARSARLVSEVPSGSVDGAYFSKLKSFGTAPLTAAVNLRGSTKTPWIISNPWVINREGTDTVMMELHRQDCMKVEGSEIEIPDSISKDHIMKRSSPSVDG